MGFLELSDEEHIPAKGAQARAGAPSAASIPNDFLESVLVYWHTPDAHEEYELADIAKPDAKLHAGCAALIAACVETESKASMLHSEGALEHDIERVMHASVGDPKRTLGTVRIAMLDWRNLFRLCAVSVAQKGGMMLSFTAVPLSDIRMNNGFGCDNLRRTIYDLLQEAYQKGSWESRVMHLVLRRRGSGSLVEVEKPAFSFFRWRGRRRQPDGDTDTSGSDPDGKRPKTPSVPPAEASPRVQAISIRQFMTGAEDSLMAGEPEATVRARAAKNPCMQHLIAQATLIERCPTEQLYTNDTYKTGKYFRSVTYEAIRHDVRVTVQCHLPADNGAAARYQNAVLSGAEARTRVLHDLTKFAPVRVWFLSCVLRGRIVLDARSRGVGFLPDDDVCDGGVVMETPFRLPDFEAVGGGVVTIGPHVVFKAFAEGDARFVTDVSPEGGLTLGAPFMQTGLPVVEAYAWTAPALYVAGKDVSAGDHATEPVTTDPGVDSTAEREEASQARPLDSADSPERADGADSIQDAKSARAQHARSADFLKADKICCRIM